MAKGGCKLGFETACRKGLTDSVPAGVTGQASG